MLRREVLIVGNTSWVCPRTGRYFVECSAGGGGGGTYGRTSSAHGAGGGGGGAYAGSWVNCIQGTSYTVVVGQGGAGATSNNSNGSNGNNTSFNNSEILAANGRGGLRTGVAGAGGLDTACIGTYRFSGGNGGANSGTTGGGGGAGGGIAGNGNAGSAPTGGAGRWMDNIYYENIRDESGEGGNGGTANISGSDGEATGGGGGGAGSNGGVTVKTGGLGDNGYIFIIYPHIWGADTLITYGRA